MKAEMLAVYRVTIISDRVAGKLDVASNDLDEVHEIARDWAKQMGIGLITEIRVTAKQQYQMPYSVCVAKG